MTTLLLRLEGPMQAWGTDSRFEKRFTGRDPAKSGVIGLLCAALGKPRGERPADGHPSLSALAALRMGVRIDRGGALQADYHTAGNLFADGTGGVLTAGGRVRKFAVLSTRYYLAGASFLAGLEGERVLLQQLHTALRTPVWQICLGRKAFVPSSPVYLHDGLVDEPLEVALLRYWPVEGEPQGGSRARDPRQPPALLQAVLDDPAGSSGDVRLDVPEDFAARRFGPRAVRQLTLERPAALLVEGG